MKAMKVLFLTNIPSPYRVTFFNALGVLCDLTVLFESASAKSRNNAWKAENEKTYQAIFLEGIKFGEAEAICPSVFKYLSPKKYDVIVVGMYSSPTGMLAIEYMRIRKIPFIISSDGGIIKEDAGLRHYLKQHFISAAAAWLSTGKYTTDYLCYYGADRSRVYKYPFTSVSEKDLLNEQISLNQKNELKRRLGITEKKVVLSVGQFVHRKGYDLLLKHWKNVNTDIGLYIIGGKPTEEYLKLKEEAGCSKIYFKDFMSKDQLAEYYKIADLFVLPTREDIWGLVINEAMAFGVPVITTDKCVAGLEMIESDVNGRIVSIDAVWDKEIIEILDIADYCSMKRECLRIAQEYTTENMAKRHIEIFEALGGHKL